MDAAALPTFGGRAPLSGRNRHSLTLPRWLPSCAHCVLRWEWTSVQQVSNVEFYVTCADVAVVGYPDKRMGERGCAFVVLKDGGPFSMDDMRTWMQENGAAKQYWPEALEIIEIMPRTASGKIQKFALREKASAHSDV